MTFLVVAQAPGGHLLNKNNLKLGDRPSMLVFGLMVDCCLPCIRCSFLILVTDKKEGILTLKKRTTVTKTFFEVFQTYLFIQ